MYTEYELEASNRKTKGEILWAEKNKAKGK